MSVAEADRGVQLETIDDAAKRLRIHRATMYRQLKEAGVRIYKVGRSSRVRIDEVNRAFLGDQVDHADIADEPEPTPLRRGPGRPPKERPADPRFAELAERLEEVARQLHAVADEVARER